MVTVICYGKMEQWKSRKEAMSFYLQGANACDGCEANRYFNVYSQLNIGCHMCVDDNYTAEQLEQIQQRYKYVHSKEFDNYCLISKSATVDEYDSYFGYRIQDKYGNRWYLQCEQGVLSLHLLSDYRKIKEYKVKFELLVDGCVNVLEVEKWWVDAGKTTQRMIVTAPTSLQQFKRIIQSAVNRVGAKTIREDCKL